MVGGMRRAFRADGDYQIALARCPPEITRRTKNDFFCYVDSSKICPHDSFVTFFPKPGKFDCHDFGHSISGTVGRIVRVGISPGDRCVVFVMWEHHRFSRGRRGRGIFGAGIHAEITIEDFVIWANITFI